MRKLRIFHVKSGKNIVSHVNYISTNTIVYMFEDRHVNMNMQFSP